MMLLSFTLFMPRSTTVVLPLGNSRIRNTFASVPVVYMSFNPGFSMRASFWQTTAIKPSSLSASLISLNDELRTTEIGCNVIGNNTVLRSGNNGKVRSVNGSIFSSSRITLKSAIKEMPPSSYISSS